MKQSEELAVLSERLSLIIGKDKQIKEILFHPKKQITVLMRIFMNYSQTISIIDSIELKWPFEFQIFLGILSNAGNISSNLFSFDCFLDSSDVNLDSFYSKTFFFILLPALIIFTTSLITTTILKKRKKVMKFNHFIVIIIVTCIFFQPNTIQLLFDNIICKKLDGIFYLKEKMIINCNEERHKLW